MKQSYLVILMQHILSTLDPRASAASMRRELKVLLCGLTVLSVGAFTFAQEPSTPTPARGLNLEDAPAGPPQVLWNGSQLSIITNNSTLADILAAVRAHTGAEIDMPESASHERMAARLGPGPIREVLSSLLSWTGFNYVIQASEKNPDGIQSIMLISRPKDTVQVAMESPTAASRTARGGYIQGPEANPNLAGAHEQLENPISSQSTTAVESAVSPDPGTELPAMTPTHNAEADISHSVAEIQHSSTNPQTPVSTPESVADLNQPKPPAQMVEQLQSMYQQRLQLQETQKAHTDQTP